MNKINNFYVDKNNNRWDADIYTKKEAMTYSESLVNCSDCHNCHNCRNCSYCSYCHNCSECRNCSDCSYCGNCSDCSNCGNCSYCSNCRDCSNCHNCRDCSNCHNCRDFNINPQRYVTPKVGSRDDNTTIYWVGNNVQVVCGCFRGNVDEWEAKIKETHKYNEKHLKDYLEQVEIVRKIMEMTSIKE